MNHYDDEKNIIQSLQFTSCREIYFVNATREAKKFFLSLFRERKFSDWMNSSGKDAPPPDFFSPKYKYMLEVMRTDDFEMGHNSPNALESKYVKQIEDMLRENGSRSLKESNIHLFVTPDMSKASKNGYPIYVENFKRIVHKHVEKIHSYRENHPGYKLGFLIFDEAPAYMRVKERNTNPKPGEMIGGFPHAHFYDRNLVESFIDADVDYVIWMTPHKFFWGNPRIMPRICIFDLTKKENLKKHLLGYSTDQMVCLECE